MSTPATHLQLLLGRLDDDQLTATFDESLREFEIVYTDERGNRRRFTMPIEPEDLWNRIQVPESDRDALWPDASVEEVSLRLFYTHVEEAVMMAREGEDILVKERGRVRAVSR